MPLVQIVRVGLSGDSSLIPMANNGAYRNVFTLDRTRKDYA